MSTAIDPAMFLEMLRAKCGSPTTLGQLTAKDIESAIQAAQPLPFPDIPLPPPPPAELYSKHWQRIGVRLSATSFLLQYWDIYTSSHMLLWSHLRGHDEALSHALRREAEKSGNADKYLLQNGVFTRASLFLAPPELRPQALRLLQFATLEVGLKQKHYDREHVLRSQHSRIEI